MCRWLEAIQSAIALPGSEPIDGVDIQFVWVRSPIQSAIDHDAWLTWFRVRIGQDHRTTHDPVAHCSHL
jgi:hypothetical protein